MRSELFLWFLRGGVLQTVFNKFQNILSLPSPSPQRKKLLAQAYSEKSGTFVL